MGRKRFAIPGAYMLVWPNKNNVQSIPGGRVRGGPIEKKIVQVKSNEANTRHTANKRAQHGSNKEPRECRRVSQPSQRTIRSREVGREPSIPGEYRRYHLVYRTKGGTELVVLFVIVVDLYLVPDGINIHRRNPTRFLLLHFIISFEVSLGLSLTMLVLGLFCVSPREETPDGPTQPTIFISRGRTSPSSSVPVRSSVTVKDNCEVSSPSCTTRLARIPLVSLSPPSEPNPSTSSTAFLLPPTGPSSNPPRTVVALLAVRLWLLYVLAATSFPPLQRS
jgi:hypothetical protein